MAVGTILVCIGFIVCASSQELGSGVERRYACWGSAGPPVVSAQCPRGTLISVTKAGLKVQNHGGMCEYSENDCGCIYGEVGCNMPDVRSVCMGRAACRLDVMQQYINTDQCRGFSDYMYIEFACVPESEYEDALAELAEQDAITQEDQNTDAEEDDFRAPNNALVGENNGNLNRQRTREGNNSRRRQGSGPGGRRTNGQQIPNIRDQETMDDNEQSNNQRPIAPRGQGRGPQRNSQRAQQVSNRNDGSSQQGDVPRQNTASQMNICTNSITTGRTGFIGSPALESVTSTEQCHCTMTASPYSTISLSILTYRSSSCTYNVLTVNTPAKTITLCEENAGTGTLDSQANQISLAFTASRSAAEDGRFWLKYEANPPSQIKLQCKYNIVDDDLQIEEELVEDIDTEPVRSDDVLTDSNRDNSWWWKITARTPAESFPPWLHDVDTTEVSRWSDKDVDLSKQESMNDLITYKPTVLGVNTKPTYQHPRNSHLKNNLQSYPLDRRDNAADKEFDKENLQEKEEPMTVTIIAACVIGSILLIVIVGIVVRFVINRADPMHMLRQSHKKNCVVRKNAQMRGSRIFP